MSVPINWAELPPSDHPSFDACLEVANAYNWPPEEIRQYMSAAHVAARQTFLGRTAAWHIVRRVRMLSPPIDYFYRKHVELEWQHVPVTDDLHYDRDGQMVPLPHGAQGLVNKIRMFMPDTQFRVSYLGPDPVLWCSGPDPRNPSRQRQRAVWVWAEDRQKREIMIIPPPSALPEWMRHFTR